MPEASPTARLLTYKHREVVDLQAPRSCWPTSTARLLAYRSINARLVSGSLRLRRCAGPSSTTTPTLTPCTGHVEAVLGQQLVKVVARDAARDGGEARGPGRHSGRAMP